MSVDDFYVSLKRFLNGKKLESVSFWGGEPLLYFDKIKELHRLFVNDSEKPFFGFSTNGILLNNEMTNYVIDNNINAGISYDGDGQSLRGFDLENDKNVVDCLRKTNDAKLLTFLPVMTNLNKDILLYQDKVERILGTKDFVINEIVISTVMDENGYKNRIPEEYLPIMSSKIYADYLNGKLNRIINEKKRAYAFILSIENKNRVFSCFATRENFIPIDLEGNLLACHNFNKGNVCGGETLYLGNIKNMKLGKKPKQKTKALLDRRKRLCSDCLVRQLCQGGCAYQTLEYEEYNCMSHFYHYAAVFAMAVSIMTGRVVKEIVKT
jgi:uncharacterized protein